MKNYRIISDEEFQTAYYGGPTPESQATALDHRNIIHSVTSKFTKLSETERHSCGLVAMFHCLQQHDSSHKSGQKFTSSLYRFTVWECKKALQEKAPASKRKYDDMYYWSGLQRHFDASTTESIEDSEPVELMRHIKECVTTLNDKKTRDIINGYFFEKKTLVDLGNRHGLSVEAMRMSVKRAVKVVYQVVRHKLGLRIYNFEMDT
jgi:hypothetical protein